MFSNEYLENIIQDQRRMFEKKNPGIERDINFSRYLSVPQIIVITGVRRCGKSTLLKQFATRSEPYYYLNFDDDRLLDFTVADFQNLYVTFKKQHDARFVFLDEVQSVAGWESFVRRLFEDGYKVFITGSNAKLLSGELASRLTGRYFKIDLLPFSFKEFGRYRQFDFMDRSSTNEAAALKLFDDYVTQGGFPELVKTGDQEIAKQIYEDIVYHDLIGRYKLRDTRSFRALANYLFTNIAKETSYPALARAVQIKTTASARNNTHYMIDAYLLFEVVKYDFSLKKQYASGRKLYVIDHGLRNAVAFAFSNDIGRVLENIVQVELVRRGLEPYYFKNKGECDFLIRQKNKITGALQVTSNLNRQNRERELLGLKEALRMAGIAEGTILTLSQNEEITEDGFTIQVKPLWRWLAE